MSGGTGAQAEIDTGGSFRGRLAVIAALGLIGRLAVVVWLPTRPVSDFWSYLERARLLVVAGQYGAFLGLPDASFPPGYPLLLSLVHLAPGDPLLLAKLLNCLLGTATVVLVGMVARLIGGRWAGWIGAALAAFHPRGLLMPVLVASENLFTPLLLLFVLLLLRAVPRPRALRLAAFSGLALGGLTLTRCVGYFLGLIWPATAFVAGKRWRAILAETALVLGLQHGVLLPWAIRNEVTFGRFTFLNSISGLGLYTGNSDEATGGWYNWVPALRRQVPDLDTKQAFEQDDAARRVALSWIRSHPRRALELYFFKLRLLVLGDETYLVHSAVIGGGIAPPTKGVVLVLANPHFLSRHATALLRVLTLWHAAAFALGLLGCAWLVSRAARRRSREGAAVAFAIVGCATYLLLAAAAVIGLTRYRWPSSDLLLACAALPLCALVLRLGPAARRPAPLAVLLLACVASPPARAQEFPSIRGEHRVLVTVDDLPIPSRQLHPEAAEREKLTRDLLAVLRKHRIEAVGFVVGRNLAGPADEHLLELWLEAGHELGSHTHSHLDYSRTEAAAYLEDAETGRRWLQSFLARHGRSLRLFRFPFLREGDTREKLDRMRAWLSGNGLRNTPVTIDGQDWSFEAPWVEARRAGDTRRLQRLAGDYQTALRLEVASYTADGDAIVERTTPQVLLLHANEVGAAQWDALLGWMEGQGFRFARADEVLADPAIASLPDFTGRYGGSHWYRIRQERREAKAREQVTALLARQAEAWSRGDLDGFCAAYSDDAVFVAPSGLTQGRRAVLDRYKARYPDRQAMGTLRLDVLELRSLWGPEVSLLGDALPGAVHAVSVTARWTIVKSDGSQASGLTLLVLRRASDSWSIVSDASM